LHFAEILVAVDPRLAVFQLDPHVDVSRRIQQLSGLIAPAGVDQPFEIVVRDLQNRALGQQQRHRHNA
jgi:hypothetical protein